MLLTSPLKLKKAFLYTVWNFKFSFYTSKTSQWVSKSEIELKFWATSPFTQIIHRERCADRANGPNNVNQRYTRLMKKLTILFVIALPTLFSFWLANLFFFLWNECIIFIRDFQLYWHGKRLHYYTWLSLGSNFYI